MVENIKSTVEEEREREISLIKIISDRWVICQKIAENPYWMLNSLNYHSLTHLRDTLAVGPGKEFSDFLPKNSFKYNGTFSSQLKCEFL